MYTLIHVKKKPQKKKGVEGKRLGGKAPVPVVRRCDMRVGPRQGL